jgi:hypothetical protein
VPDFLPFRPRCPPMIVTGLIQRARFMRWPHVAEIIGTTKFKSANVLNDPALAHSINLALAQHANTTCLLPHLKPSVRCEFPTNYRAHILNP